MFPSTILAFLLTALFLSAAFATLPEPTSADPAEPEPFAADGILENAPGGGKYYQVTYAPSDFPGELSLGVQYTVWIPNGVKTLRGVIVHQHGCGEGACRGGATAAYDSHWQALAKKWDCALLGPSYQQKDGTNCQLWCDPRRGSAKAFLNGLRDLGVQSNHPELEKVPWCLWGHSGGGLWSSTMQTLYPERIVAIWLRSGTAFGRWGTGDIPAQTIPEAAYGIPVVCNPGAKEKGHQQFNGAYTGAVAMFEAYRAKGAPIAFAADPRTVHECGDSRYLAIPFFDACLGLRLPPKGKPDAPLKPIDPKKGWLAPPVYVPEGGFPSSIAVTPPVRSTDYSSDATKTVWLPNEDVAKAWSDYVTTGTVTDTTPPPSPKNVRKMSLPSGGIELMWEAETDFESGSGGFVILRDGVEIARLPEKPNPRYGRPLFQTMSYHDTPEKPLPALRYQDTLTATTERPTYEVVALNSAGLRSKPTKAR